MQLDAIDHDRIHPRMALSAKRRRVENFDRRSTGNCDAMVTTALAVNGEMRQAHLLESFFWELSVLAFDFLKADHIRLFGFDKGLDIGQAQPNGIDIPTHKLEGGRSHPDRLSYRGLSRQRARTFRVIRARNALGFSATGLTQYGRYARPGCIIVQFYNSANYSSSIGMKLRREACNVTVPISSVSASIRTGTWAPFGRGASHMRNGPSMPERLSLLISWAS